MLFQEIFEIWSLPMQLVAIYLDKPRHFVFRTNSTGIVRGENHHLFY